MAARLACLSLVLFVAASAHAKDVYLPVTGTASGFYSDLRIVNPSFEKDIIVTARYLRAGEFDNVTVAPKTITIAKRSMTVIDNVVPTLFAAPEPLGAIRLTSDDDFIATQRIYADKRTEKQEGTLGQFVHGLDATAAKKKGIAAQLKVGQSALGNFRTNWGGVNPNPVVANIDFKLYDRNNQLAGTNRLTLQPYGVFSPLSIVTFFGLSESAVDLTDGWFSYESDQPVFIYASVIDSGSEDPTYIATSEDTGVAPTEPPPQQKVVTIVASDWDFSVTQSAPLAAGDQVKFIISKSEGTHAFRLSSPGGATLINASPMPNSPTEFLVTLPSAGSYFYVCTNSLCGEGHFQMSGTLTVGASSAKQEESHHHH